MKTYPAITNFNAGAFSPLMAGRVDLKQYANACDRIRNFILTPQGPARRRPGTRFVTEVRDASANREWLAPFIFSSDQAYVIEFAHQYYRIMANHGVVIDGLASPYTAANLTAADGTFACRWAQSYDVMYITNPATYPRKLIRTGASTFATGDLIPLQGPWKDTNPSQTISIYSNANTGATLTLTASGALFNASMVLSLIRLEAEFTDDIKMWEPGKVRAVNDVRRSDGKNYHALNAATTGTVKPTHDVGAKYDGDAGVQWQFDDPNYGWGLISAYTSPTVITIIPITRIPDMAVGAGNATLRWALGAFGFNSSTDPYLNQGWPECVGFYRDRLVLSKGRTLYGSVTGDYENFNDRDSGGLTTVDQGFTYTLAGDKADTIKWIQELGPALLIGTGGDEHAVYEAASGEPFGPGNAVARKQSENGSKAVAPVLVGHGVIYTQKSGQTIRDMKAAESVDTRWESIDLNVLADHICKSGIIQMGYQHKRDSVVWSVLADGQLVGFTLNREQEVRGWHTHRLGGYSNSAQTEFAIVESVAVIPAPNKDRDEVWMIVKRYANGGVKRYVEWMEYGHQYGDDPEDQFYVDCGLTYDGKVAQTLTVGSGALVVGTEDVPFTAGAAIFSASDVGRFIHYRYYEMNVKGEKVWKKGIARIDFVDYALTTVRCTIKSPWPNTNTMAVNTWRLTATTISGLSHLNGCTVDVLADGAAHPQRVVSGGQITLQEPASKVHVGLPCPAVLRPMSIDLQMPDGTSQGRTKRPNKVSIRFHETGAAKYGRDEDAQLDQVLNRGGSNAMDQALPLFSGIKTVAWPDGYDKDIGIAIVADQPFACTVTGIYPEVNA